MRNSNTFILGCLHKHKKEFNTSLFHLPLTRLSKDSFIMYETHNNLIKEFRGMLLKTLSRKPSAHFEERLKRVL